MDENLRVQAKTFLEETGGTIAGIARALQISDSTLSLWLAGKYTGNVNKIENKLKQFLKLQRERKDTSKKEIPFIMICAAARFFEIARLAHLEGEVAVCYGEPGTGKTKACKKYAEENDDVVLIEVDLGYSPRVLFTELHKRLGFEGRGSIHAMFEDCVGRLKNSGRLLIFDEAEYLPYRALELLRRVHDKAGIGILLVGLPRLIENLRGKKGEYVQFYSRVGAATKLEALHESDTGQIVKSVLPSLNGMWRVFHEQCHGNARVLSKLLFRSIQIAKINGKAVTPEIVRGAAQTLII